MSLDHQLTQLLSLLSIWLHSSKTTPAAGTGYVFPSGTVCSDANSTHQKGCRDDQACGKGTFPLVMCVLGTGA